jgi:hypothetical protein
MTDQELELAREDVWHALAAWPIRRSVLGRERSDALTRVALGQLAAVEVDVQALGQIAGYRQAVCRRVERRVRAVYAENCGMAFTTLILVWAISAIVQVLVIRWLNREAGS